MYKTHTSHATQEIISGSKWGWTHVGPPQLEGEEFLSFLKGALPFPIKTALLKSASKSIMDPPGGLKTECTREATDPGGMVRTILLLQS